MVDFGKSDKMRTIRGKWMNQNTDKGLKNDISISFLNKNEISLLNPFLGRTASTYIVGQFLTGFLLDMNSEFSFF